MALSSDAVERLARLARIEIGAEEAPGVVTKLGGIVEFIGQLETADTTDVTPMAHPLDRGQRLREDEVTESDARDQYQANAAAVRDGLYLVPKVID